MIPFFKKATTKMKGSTAPTPTARKRGIAARRASRAERVAQRRAAAAVRGGGANGRRIMTDRASVATPSTPSSTTTNTTQAKQATPRSPTTSTQPLPMAMCGARRTVPAVATKPAATKQTEKPERALLVVKSRGVTEQSAQSQSKPAKRQEDPVAIRQEGSVLWIE